MIDLKIEWKRNSYLEFILIDVSIAINFLSYITPDQLLYACFVPLVMSYCMCIVECKILRIVTGFVHKYLLEILKSNVQDTEHNVLYLLLHAISDKKRENLEY